MRPLIGVFLQILLLGTLGTLVAAAEECSASKPCETGCCSKYGYCGLGPDFCSKEVCVNNCERKAECDPGEFGKEYVEKSKCPLNVCCSRHGFCGTTKDFCGSKKVKRPSCSVNDQGFDRVVGYYEGWSSARPCNKFYPEQLPVGVYTHLNYAFASIDPDTFEVIPSLTSDVDMYKRVTNLKKADPDLKVFIAIGGWTFNDPGPTATTFSDIARSEANTKKFAKSLISFMSTYDFDGVDLDWEYPGADDRSGRVEDFETFPVFLRRLKAALKASGGRDGVSLTLPASYWYLQHFDIQAIQKHVDFLNIMSYDLHGTWDKENEWVGPYLNAHTNLTEITQALDLLWRNNISPDKVVLGLAFYGRAFTVASTGCTKPGCEYASGGKKRSCSGEVSVILNSEIDNVVESSAAKATLYKAEAVKVLNYESNQWVAYDDKETFKLKADFARGQCLGGLMVWAVSHDTKDAKYTSALAAAANRKFVAALPATDDSLSTTRNKHAQCKWTNCGEQCPSGWLRVPRRDGGERKNEYMIDEQGCNGISFHQLCCPPGEEVPKCGWYDFNGGKCGGKCPVAMFEIGSNSMYCRSSYQAACCFGTATAMHLHNQCSWSADFPNCNRGECTSDNAELAKSMTGSGGAFCKEIGGGDPFSNAKPPRQERKYCCRDDLDDQKWTDCEWESHIGVFPQDWARSSGYCLSGCPSDKVRVAMDHNTKECTRGARAKCCTPAYSTIVKKSPQEDEELADALEIFLDNPVCTNNTQSYRYDSQETVISRLSKILYGSVSLDTVNTWDSKIGAKYEYLKYKSIREWARSDEYAFQIGSTKLPESIICQISYYNSLISGGDVLKCYEGTSDRPKRSLTFPFDTLAYSAARDDISPISPRGLQKRDQEYKINMISGLTGAQVMFSVFGISYPRSGEWYPTEPIWNRVLDFTTSQCFDATVGAIFRSPGNNDHLATEHIFEKQGVVNFIKATISGILPSGAASAFNAIDPSFWTTTALVPLAANIPPIGGGEMAPMRRIMTRLGADNYRTVFVLAAETLNTAKATIWSYHEPADAGEMANLLNTNTVGFLNQIRLALGSFVYLNTPIVNPLLVNIMTNIRYELGLADQLHQTIHGAASAVHAVARFDEWAADHFEVMATNVQEWAFEWIGEALLVWRAQPNHPAYDQMINALQMLGALAGGISVNLDNVPGQ